MPSFLKPTTASNTETSYLQQFKQLIDQFTEQLFPEAKRLYNGGSQFII